MDSPTRLEPSDLVVHPRLTQQGIGEDGVRTALSATLPKLQPFFEGDLHALVAVLDWDHHLPSRGYILRLQLCYDNEAAEALRTAVRERGVEIRGRDFFPEFDVPDYAGLPADECYEAELTLDLGIGAIRLASAWRRDVDETLASLVVEVVRGSSQFAEARAATPDRPASLGDLEAVGWTPPCESGQARWGIDVWWLTSFDGRIGRGWSFLVDPKPGDADAILSTREFTIRAG